MEQKKKNKRIKVNCALCAMLVLLVGCGSTSGNGFSPADSPEAGSQVQDTGEGIKEGEGVQETDIAQKMPVFTAKDLDGNTVTESIFGEKDLTVVNIWGTFCNPCVREMPELGEWEKQMPDNVQMVGLIIDINGDDDTERHGLAVDIVQNAGADYVQIIANQDFADILKEVIGVPTTMFVDKDGNIVGDPIIGADVDGYKKFVEDYLNGQ